MLPMVLIECALELPNLRCEGVLCFIVVRGMGLVGDQSQNVGTVSTGDPKGKCEGCERAEFRLVIAVWVDRMEVGMWSGHATHYATEVKSRANLNDQWMPKRSSWKSEERPCRIDR